MVPPTDRTLKKRQTNRYLLRTKINQPAYMIIMQNKSTTLLVNYSLIKACTYYSTLPNHLVIRITIF